jgi:hypothetical protein
MTDLLTAVSQRLAPPGAGTGPATARPLWLSAALAGVAAPLTVLLGCMAIALAGWFASDAGSHGDTRDALRVGADAWLLGHGARLEVAGATITAVPLGLTLFCLDVAHRLGRWAAATSAAEDLRGTALAAVVLAGLYGVTGVVTAVLASLHSAGVGPGRAFVGAFVVGLTGGGAGLLGHGRLGSRLHAALPGTVRVVVIGGMAAALLMGAAGATLTVAALLGDLGEAANVLARLHTDPAGGALYTVVVAGVAPNAALLGAAYLLGPGFAVGTGTVVSPALVVLGPVPAFPLLAALPQPGAGPLWHSALVTVPVLAGALGVALVMRRHPDARYETGAGRGLAAGLLGGVLLAVAIQLAGGAVGPGRMADVGAPLLDVLLMASLSLGGGGLLAGLLMTWRFRRGLRPSSAGPGRRDRDESDTEDTVRL